jgi:DNA-binding GntR family transcriptional regulator
VVESLRDAIIAGELQDGERLIEDKIARELKTSRGPVREALRQLEHEGFVVSYPYRGAVVIGVSDEEVQQVLIPVRLTVEKYSIPKAVEQMTDEDFAELGKEVWRLGEAARTNDLEQSVDADMRFHEILLEHSGQQQAAQVWRSIAPRIRAYFFRYGRKSSLGQIAVEHGELLTALQTRDPDVIAAALEQHITVRTPAPA